MCLNNWSKKGLVKYEDLKEAAGLPEVGSDEGDSEPDDFGMVL